MSNRFVWEDGDVEITLGDPKANEENNPHGCPHCKLPIMKCDCDRENPELPELDYQGGPR